jgi:hypothetical protein
MTILWIIGLIVVCAILYRLGGRGGAWYKNTKMRDLGCAVCCIALLYFVAGWSWWSLAVFLPLWGALSQYWKFGQEDCQWYHWVFHGLGCGIAFLPYAYFTGHMLAWYIQVPAVGILMCVWSQSTDNDWAEELGRGAILGASCLLYLIR